MLIGCPFSDHKFLLGSFSELKINDNILLSIDKCCPLKKIKDRNDQKCPWFDSELRTLRNYRDFCYHNYLNCKDSINLNDYREARSAVLALHLL
ncbi:hypothetical protein BpHYR1_010854 [Brachionus plicatilis]|uniref:RNA-directed DNA polymerase from mobile element jockey-like n=1 Tax=Brachionus plicatilis TaxID=10195 RepID=A0A3M7R4T6_BRAPC|nr:hypothetical protein BpHYR1_010854 [Brachionus plicatilis]